MLVFKSCSTRNLLLDFYCSWVLWGILGGMWAAPGALPRAAVFLCFPRGCADGKITLLPYLHLQSLFVWGGKGGERRRTRSLPSFADSVLIPWWTDSFRNQINFKRHGESYTQQSQGWIGWFLEFIRSSFVLDLTSVCLKVTVLETSALIPSEKLSNIFEYRPLTN